MYYYIVDPPQTKTDQNSIATIRNRLVPEGLAGEFVFRTPGQSSSTLAEKALAQGFSTIVAIGDDTLAGELAVVLYDQPSALGIIPMHASPSLHALIGYSDWQSGIAALRARKLALRDLGIINGEKAFLTEVVVKTPKPTNFQIHMNRFTVSTDTDALTLRLSSDIAPFDIPGVINFVTMKQAPSRGLFGFMKSDSSPYDTILRSEQAVIQTETPAQVLYSGISIAETPLSVSIIPQAIRMVVARQGRGTAAS